MIKVDSFTWEKEKGWVNTLEHRLKEDFTNHLFKDFVTPFEYNTFSSVKFFLIRSKFADVNYHLLQLKDNEARLSITTVTNEFYAKEVDGFTSITLENIFVKYELVNDEAILTLYNASSAIEEDPPLSLGLDGIKVVARGNEEEMTAMFSLNRIFPYFKEKYKKDLPINKDDPVYEAREFWMK